jgi:hypothetical protein
MNEEILIVICFSFFIYLVYNKLQSVIINDNNQLINNYNNIKNNKLNNIQLILNNYVKFELIYNQLDLLDTYYNELINTYSIKIKNIIKNYIYTITNSQLVIFKTLFNKKKTILYNDILLILKKKIIKKKKLNKKDKNLIILKILNNINNIMNINK